MNRDERLSRAPADPPRLWHFGRVQALAPRDGEAGGTWIGVNQHGLSAALANVYLDPPVPPPAARISRGLLVLDVLACDTGEKAKELLRTRSLSRYEPFHLIVFTPGRDPWGCRWDGRARSETHHGAPGLVATSSPLDPEGTEQMRRAYFDAAAAAEGGFTSRLLDELHRSRKPEPYAISMKEGNAGTVSLSTIRVTPSVVSFTYTPGAPHAVEADPPVSLPRPISTTEAGHLPDTARG